MTHIGVTRCGDATMEIVDSDATSSFSNTGAAGINRLVPLDGLLLVDNIGRNFELRDPAWIQRALYDVTIFPGEDNPSILDSDVHGAFLTSDRQWLLVGNHFGRVRGFAWPLSGPGSPSRPFPSVELQLPGDTERLAFDGTRLITSSPRGSYTPDPPRPGIFISEPVTPLLTASPAGELRRLDCRCELADWGVITALAFEPSRRLLAVSAGERLGLFGLDCDDRGELRRFWTADLGHAAQWLAFDESGHLLVGGHESGSDADGSEWNACRGGTLTVRSVAGNEIGRVVLPDATAWGYGSDPIVLSENGQVAYVVDRVAGVHAIDLATGQTDCLHEGVASAENESLGIGHAVRIAGYLYVGFSRGGYRVFRFSVGT
jgi:sugar lactone lactonase YvrE